MTSKDFKKGIAKALHRHNKKRFDATVKNVSLPTQAEGQTALRPFVIGKGRIGGKSYLGGGQ